jgi:hypothetical protein
MKRYWNVLMLLVILIGCSPLSMIPAETPLPKPRPTSSPTPTPAHDLSDGIMLSDTQAVVNKMKALCCEDGWLNYLVEAEHKYDEATKNGAEFDTGAAFLESMEAAGVRFDANEYFTVLSHLAPEDRYVLDYVYYAPDGFGAPYLYARRDNEPKIENYSEYEKDGFENYLSHIRVDGTAEGYYELVLLKIMGVQFYLYWHAGYYDLEVVSSRERLEEIIESLNERNHSLTDEQAESIMQLDVTPRVIFKGDKVRVRVLVFTKWGGFFERVYTINRNFPHKMIEDEIQLIPYNCGIVF